MYSCINQDSRIPIWRTNSLTKKAYRLNDDDLVSIRKRHKLPSRFKRDSVFDWWSRQSAALIQLAYGRKGSQLLKHHKKLYFYTLSAKELGGEAWLEEPENYDNPAAIEQWQRHLDRAFPNMPYKWALHCGRDNRVAPHVISGADNAIPYPSRDPRRRKRIKNTAKDYRRAFAYLTSKSYSTPRQVKTFKRAVKEFGGVRNLPQHSGYRNMEFVRKSVKNSLSDGVVEKVSNGMRLHEKPHALTPPKFEAWLSKSFGRFTKHALSSGTGPPAEVNAMA